MFAETEDPKSDDDKSTELIVNNAIDKLIKMNPSSIDDISAIVAEVRQNLNQ